MPVVVNVRGLRAPVRGTALRRTAERLLCSVQEQSSELGVELVGDGRMRRLNRTYRNIDRSTDVLAFPMREARGPSSPILGDVVISLPAARRQAKEKGHSIDEEVAILLIHGILHLCGYDHECDEREALRMARRERAILAKLRPVPRLVAPMTDRARRNP